MATAVSRWVPRFLRRSAPPAIDLGGGRLVAPEDLLEGHFLRLAAQRTRPHEVSVQVRPALKSVIQVAAPTLAPLTQLAEQVAGTLPTVQPAPDFRSQLHRALEEAHRRRLESPAPSQAERDWVTLLAATLVALGAAGLVLYLLRRR